MTSNPDLFIASVAAMTDNTAGGTACNVRCAGGEAALACCGCGASCTMNLCGCVGSFVYFAAARTPAPLATRGGWLPDGDVAVAVLKADTPLRPPQV